MQLPRGTFRYIKKDTKLGGILEELQVMKFSGICTISFGSANGSLVFKTGKRILAEFRNVAGDAAWIEFQKIFNDKVDASVSAMDDTQIELSLEFNKSCRIGKGKPEQSPPFSSKIGHILPVKKSPHVSIGEPVAPPAKNLQKPHLPEIPVAPPAVTFETLRIPEPSQTIVPAKSPPPAPYIHSSAVHKQSPVFPQGTGEAKKREDETESSADADSKSFESDIDTLETMDVDIMTSKIRGECKSLIKQLRLEHLTER